MGGDFSIRSAERLCRRYGVTWAQSKLLLRLYEAAGDLVPGDDLLETRSHPYSGPKTLTVQVCMARKRVGYGTIETQWGKGYRLSERGLAKVKGALA